MSPESVDAATFRHVMRGGRGYMTGNPFLDRHGPFRRRSQAPRPVIGDWEAKAYVDMELEELGASARRCGFTVGRTPGSRRALEGVRVDVMERIRREYIVVST